MTTLQISFNFSVLNSRYDYPIKKTTRLLLHFSSLAQKKLVYTNRSIYNWRVSSERFSFFGEPRENAQFLKKNGVFVVKANQGFGFNGGDGGDNKITSRVLGNLVLAIGLTYLSVTGQLGWLLDAIVSIWILAVLLPIAGLGAFLWFAGRDIVQGSCPNCGNDFQIFKSSLKDGVQLCPFCSQPFSVQGKEFIRESAKFSTNKSADFGQIFNGFSRRSSSEKASTGKSSSATIVDIEAEVKDID